MAKPVLKWAGGKTQLLPQIIERLPSRVENYYEPMVGGGAVLFEMASRFPGAKLHIGDLNRELIGLYQVLGNKKLRREFEVRSQLGRWNDFSEENFKEIRELDRQSSWNPATSDKVERALRMVYLNKTCYNGLYRVNSKGQFNTSYGKYKNPQPWNQDWDAAGAVFERCEILNLGIHDYLAQVVWDVLHHRLTPETAFIYLDPPYIPISSTANFESYQSEGFSLKQHRVLANQLSHLTALGVNWMLSMSDCEASRDIYVNSSGFELTVDVVHARRSINSAGDKRGGVQELLVRNY